MNSEFPPPELDALIQTSEAYAEMSFGFRFNFEPVSEEILPERVHGLYHLWKSSIPGISIVALHHRGPDRDIIQNYEDLKGPIKSALSADAVVMIVDDLSPLVRRQMIEHRIGFLVPGSQLYIPELFLDLRDRATRTTPLNDERASPLAQSIILAALLGQEIEGANLTELAEHFRVSVMSTSRIMDELEKLGVARAKIVGRQRLLHLPVRGRLLWESVKDRLRAPARKIRFAKGALPADVARLAGKSAFAFYEGTSEPSVNRYAIAESLFRKLEDNSLVELTDRFDTDGFEVELWSYDPALLSSERAIDPLSLYLNHRHDTEKGSSDTANKILASFAW